jgi:RND superfamily putative drug exporter
MFTRWGAFVYRHRRPVALLALALAIVALPFASRASAELSSGGWLDPSSEAARVADRLAADFGGALKRLADRVGFDHVEDEDEAAVSGALPSATG